MWGMLNELQNYPDSNNYYHPCGLSHLMCYQFGEDNYHFSVPL